MQVLKFGGSSVANAANMQRVVNIVTNALETDRTILVCSAISGCTDLLIEIGQKAAAHNEQYLTLIDNLQAQHREIIKALLSEAYQQSALIDCEELFSSLRGIAQGVYLVGELTISSLEAIESFGELLSTRIIAAKFQSLGVNSRWVDSRTIIRTSRKNDTLDSECTKNVVDTTYTEAALLSLLHEEVLTGLFIFPGFIAADAAGRTTTLGRGGSDYTAAIFAAASGARRLEIWTDVTGIKTANPKVVPDARTIEYISYRAAQELSHFGAKVIYPPTIQPAVSKGIPIYVKNTFEPQAFGTLIEQNPPLGKSNLIGISNSNDIALISLEGGAMVGVPGFSSRLFDALYRADINIILITQASSVHTMCIAISERDAEKAKAAADACFAYEISLHRLNPLKVEKGYSIVCLVGDDIREQSGATGRMLAALGSHGIKVRATAQGSSERNVSVIVPSTQADKAIRHIHNEFFDHTDEQTRNLYLAGYGTVGRALVEMIHRNAEQIAVRTGKRLRICGLANTRTFVIDTDGISLKNIDEQLAAGQSAADDAYYKALQQLNPEHAIFVDCTANPSMATYYVMLMRQGYGVVACNKIPFAGELALSRAIHREASDNNCLLRYETTVGAALPIVETVHRAINSGDAIHTIEAVLSGTLGYLFSCYKGVDGPQFADIVADAKAKGYTEPDPRQDLSGRDVLRKLIILAREIGLPMEEKDVRLESLVDIKEDVLRKRYAEAQAAGQVLRYVAYLAEDATSHLGYKAEIGLRAVDASHPLATLCGTDNAAIITTDFYPSPLVVQGAGAGANQTACGLLNDILM